MSVRVTVELPEELAQRARAAAARARRSVEEVLVEWLDRAGEMPVESQSDEQVVALCEAEMDTALQEELSDLLAQNREGNLAEASAPRLEELMQVYRRGLVRKSEAWKVAVARGLKTFPD